MHKCIELLPCDWLISNLCYQAIEQVYLIKWPVSVYIYIYIYIYIQGWIGNRAYRHLFRWADAFKTESFIFFAITRDSRQQVAHWFVSCIDSVNHPITMRYRRSDEYFDPPKDRCTPTSSSSAFPTMSQQLYQEQACSAVSDAGRRVRQEEERRTVESVKCLTGTRNTASHECRIRKHF